MSDFNPGPGWVDVTDDPHEIKPSDDHIVSRIDGVTHYFKREAPMPPLPTATWTTIRVIWRDSDNVGAIYHRTPQGKWGPYEEDDLFANITSFEVLSEPRATTAKAVLEYIRDTIGDDYFGTVISDHFEVK